VTRHSAQLSRIAKSEFEFELAFSACEQVGEVGQLLRGPKSEFEFELPFLPARHPWGSGAARKASSNSNCFFCLRGTRVGAS